MSDLSAIKQAEQKHKEQKAKETQSDVRAFRADALGENMPTAKVSGLGALKIISKPSENTPEIKAEKPVSKLKAQLKEKAQDVKPAPTLTPAAPVVAKVEPKIEAKAAPHSLELPEDYDDDAVLLTSPVEPASNHKVSLAKMSRPMEILYGAGIVGTAMWLAFCAIYAVRHGVGLSPEELGAFLAGAFAPPALFWLMATMINRRADVNEYASALRAELQSLIFPSEESASIINKDVERLCRQAAEVSAASNAVLKSLQRARQGLRVEIRDFSGVSKKAEFHIDRLAQSLTEKSGQLLSVTEEIEKRTSGIDKNVQAGAQAWDNATLAVLERAGKMEAALGRGSDKILVAADRAMSKTQEVGMSLEKSCIGMNDAVDRVSGRLEGLSNRFDDHTESLSGAADNVSEEIERLVEMIRDQVEGLESTTERTVDAMSASAMTIQEHKAALTDSAEQVAKQSDYITSSITASAENLNSTVADVIAKTEGLEVRIDEKTRNLHDVVQGISKEANLIEEAGEHAANKLGEALSTAISGSESISSAVQRAVEALESSTMNAQDRADTLMVTTKQHVQVLAEAGAGNVEQVKQITELLEQSRTQIEEVSRSSETHVKALSQAITHQNEELSLSAETLLERIDSVRKSFERPLREIQTAVGEADKRHELISDVLDRRVTDLNASSDRAVSVAETIRGTLRGQAQEISTLSGQIAGQARVINEEMRTQKDGLNDEVTQSLSMLETVREALDAQARELHTLSDGAVGDITKVSAQISDGSAKVTNFTKTAFVDLEALDHSIDDKITRLSEQAKDATRSVEAVKDTLASSAQEIEPIYINAIEQAEETRTRFDALKSSYETTTQTTLDRFAQIGIMFDGRLQDLKQGTEEANILLRGSSETIQARTKDIEEASSTAHERMRDISASLQDQSSDVHLMTDQALLKIEAIQKAMNEQFFELSASVGAAVAQLEGAGDGFVRQSNNVQSEAQKVIGTFDRVGEKALDETHKLSDAADKTAARSAELVAHVKREAEALLGNANDSLFELKKAGDSFAIRAREVAEQMSGSLKTSATYGQELKSQSKAIADSSVNAAERMSKAVATMGAQLDEVNDAANDAAFKVERSREKLQTESDRLLNVSTAALDGARDAAITFTKQSESLFKASQDASEFAKSIQERETRAQREAFMSSAKFIIESLHSLSVDLTRMLDGDVSEKTWKAFQKGDVSAFTRKLIDMEGKMPLDKAQEKFASDNEFRTYAQRFIRQFEEMYDQAFEADHGALLSSTIGSSEVGKLYQFMCQVAGKDSKLGKIALKAA